MKLVRSALVVAAAVALPLVPTAAHADRYVQTDATGDVYQSPLAGDPTFTQAPDRVEGDITSTKVAHRKRVVRATIHLTSLTHAGANVHVFAIKSNRLNREVRIEAAPGHWAGHAVMSTFRGKTVHCNLRHTIDYAHHAVRLVVPRSCLGNPRYVRVAMASGTVTGDTLYVDDARASNLPDYFVYGPKVFR